MFDTYVNRVKHEANSCDFVCCNYINNRNKNNNNYYVLEEEQQQKQKQNGKTNEKICAWKIRSMKFGKNVMSKWSYSK